MKNLVIVESPAKAKTIEGYLGSEFTVKSSYGHVRDLVKDDKGIDIENGFEPIYEVPADKKALVKELKDLAKKSDIVWLASDEDREGEAISWHLKEVLEVPDSKVKRIVFHEITKPAILKAVANPRGIDIDLVDAQQARRILDRIVGFDISPILWRKIKPSLSAGRVQSVAVKLIVEREREINHFNSTSYFKVSGIFDIIGNDGKHYKLKAEISHRFENEKAAHEFLSKCIDANYSISSLEKKPVKKNPSAPFTTSTLQQEASRKLRFPVGKTMSVAQKLYESGYITYMRTDSVNLSETALELAKKEISTAYGDKYCQERQYKTNSKNSQEAHEAIRPTDFSLHSIDSTKDEMALYDLIWKRGIASQMATAEIESTTIKINGTNLEYDFSARGEVILFDGFLKVYLDSVDDDDIDDNEEVSGHLPPVKVGQEVARESISARQGFTRPPARYNEASLVSKLEELGIGRPSTYAPTISTVQNRGYVVKEERKGNIRNYKILELSSSSIVVKDLTETTGNEKGKLYPADIGLLVTDFLDEHFPEIMNYSFTANVEQEFDEIAEGRLGRKEMIAKFYGPFHKQVETTLAESERVTGERILGVEESTGLQISVRMGKYGPFAQKQNLSNEEEKPIYASLQSGQSIETITLEEVYELFKLPRKLGAYKEEEVSAAIGRFGPYIKFGKVFVSLKKEQDPISITLAEAIELIEAKLNKAETDTLRVFDENPEISIQAGRYGPYIKHGKINAALPKGTEIEKIEFTEVLRLLDEKAKAPKTGKSGRFTKTKK